MNNINWQGPYRKRPDRPGQPLEENGNTPQSSFSAQFLQHQKAQGPGSVENGGATPSYSDQFLGGTAGPPPQTPPHAYPQYQPPPVHQESPYAHQPPATGHADPFRYGYPPYQGPQIQNGYHHHHQEVPPQAGGDTRRYDHSHQPEYFQQTGYAAPAGTHIAPGQRDYRTAVTDAAGHQSGVKQQSRPWRYLDLKSRKQTGDLYKRILAYQKKNKSAVFCFTSSIPGEGVTTVLANLVAYIKNQQVSKSILVIDAHLDAGGLNTVFGLPENTYGVKDVLSNRIDISSCLYPVGPNISVLCSGSKDRRSQSSLEPDEFLKVVTTCRQMADYILIDCPPVLSSADAFSVAPTADVSFLIIQAVQVRRQVAERALAGLQNNECELGGVIMNRVQQVIPAWVYRYI